MRPKGKRIAVVAGGVVVVVLSTTAWLYRAHVRFWWLFEPMGQNAQILLEYRHRQTGIVLVRVPGGRFWMGAQKTDPAGRNYDPNAGDDEGPVHRVAVSPFLIAKYEMIQAEWVAVMQANPSVIHAAERPVDGVSWNDCMAFCRKTGLNLPTEAEWEYACRAGSEGPFSGTGNLDEIGWYDMNSGSIWQPGGKAPNGFGLYDMHSSVWEWCTDVYDENFYSKPGATEKDPICTSESEQRIVRGGCRSAGTQDCRSAARDECFPSSKLGEFGFRPAASLP